MKDDRINYTKEYGFYVGDMQHYGDAYIERIYKRFHKLKRTKTEELHKLQKLVRQEHYKTLPFANDYNKALGYSYILRHSAVTVETNDVLEPLVYINREYRNKKIHLIEEELCYINENLKAMKAELRKRHDARSHG